MINPLAGLFVLALAPADPPPGLAMLPHPSAYRMANIARAIVEGTENADGSVTVTKRYFVRPGDRVADTIRVAGLAKMPRAELPWGVRIVGNIQDIRTRCRVAVSCTTTPRATSGWRCTITVTAARGVIWFEKDVVWGYQQQVNPGPYALSRWRTP